MTSLQTWLGRAGLAAALAFPLLGPTRAIADGAPVGSATSEQKSKAQKLFTDAAAKADGGEHSDALAGFEASFEVVASPNAKLMAARQLVALGRWVEAYEALDATIDLATQSPDPKYGQTARTARDLQAETARKIGLIRVDLGGRSLTVTVGGKQVSASALAKGVAVAPGPVTVVFDGESGRTSQSATAVAGKETTVTFGTGLATSPVAPIGPDGQPVDPVQGAPPRSAEAALPLMAAGGVLVGIGGVGLIVFAAFGVTTLKSSSDLEGSCPNQQCDRELEDQVEDAKSEQVVANVGAGIGFGAAAVGLALLIPGIVLDSDDSTDTAVLRVGPSGASLQLRF